MPAIEMVMWDELMQKRQTLQYCTELRTRNWVKTWQKGSDNPIWAEGLGIAHKKDNNILLQGMIITAKLCCLCKNRRMLTLLWSCWWWKEWDNGHDNKGEIFIFDDGFKMAYQCVCEMLAWLAMNGVIVNVEKNEILNGVLYFWKYFAWNNERLFGL